MQLNLKMKPFNPRIVKVSTMEEKSKIHGFKTPNDYFESMEEQLLNRVNEMELPQHHGLSLPKNYFDDLEDRIILSMEQKTKTGKVISLFTKKWVPLVSGVAACFVAGVFVWNLLSVNNKLLADTEITTYIESGAISVDSQDLAQLLTEEEIDELALEATIFFDENLENYLLEHLDESNLYQD